MPTIEKNEDLAKKLEIDINNKYDKFIEMLNKERASLLKSLAEIKEER
jgi:hypothetical protein